MCSLVKALPETNMTDINLVVEDLYKVGRSDIKRMKKMAGELNQFGPKAVWEHQSQRLKR